MVSFIKDNNITTQQPAPDTVSVELVVNAIEQAVMNGWLTRQAVTHGWLTRKEFRAKIRQAIAEAEGK